MSIENHKWQGECAANFRLMVVWGLIIAVCSVGAAARGEEGVAYSDLMNRLEAQELRIATLELQQQQVQRIPAVSLDDYTASQEDVENRLHQMEAELAELRSENVTSDDSEKKWYEKLSLRGYAQFRYNNTLFTEPGSAPAQHVGDRSVGENENFFIRRARLIVSGDVSDHMFVYLQPDFTSTPPGSPDATYFAQFRDWYADCYIDETKVYRFRVGQSKLPYGFENMQSSSNRIPLDRSDSTNSSMRNERDLGVFFYWTPEYAQDFFDYVLDAGLKGSGNYGMFAFGVYNGQGGALLEQNDNVHAVSRLTLPIELENGQLLEAGIQAYCGNYTVLSAPISPLGVGPAVRPVGTLETGNEAGMLDERICGTLVWYPQPIGLQTEWNVGRGPALNDAQTDVVVRPLYGGYVMLFMRHETDCYGVFFPFARYNRYKGGYKQERNAPFSQVDEVEAGLEWQLNKNMEFTAMVTATNRTNTQAVGTADTESYGQFRGDLLRFQFQFTY